MSVRKRFCGLVPIIAVLLVGCGGTDTGFVTSVLTISYEPASFNYFAEEREQLGPIAAGNCRVVVIRPDKSFGSGLETVLRIDGGLIAVGNGASIAWEEPAGECTLSHSFFVPSYSQQQPRIDPITFKTLEKESYYVQIVLEPGPARLVRLDEAAGQKLLAEHMPVVTNPVLEAWRNR